MKLIQAPSPNWNARPSGVRIDCIVLHCTADTNTKASVNWCQSPKSKVSYHQIIDRDGTVYSLVDLHKRAWHAGVSSFNGRGDCNDYAIGISFGNNNAGEVYPEVQLAVGAAVVAGCMKGFPEITLDRITTHAAVAPGRKTDPAPPFDLAAFKLRVQGELLRL
jgi:N-acetyl-anhydromuramyl-L-alanine amidase AmpD